MEEHVFHSSLSPDEIEKNFENFDFFGSLMESLGEALDYAQGKDTSKVVVTQRQIQDVDVSEVRASVNMTQKAFASVLGVSPRTVESWECNRSTPSPTAKKLIYLIRDDPTIVQRLQGI